MNMRGKTFTGALLAAAVWFAAAAQAQVTAPTNLSLTPKPGSESTALNLTWTKGSFGPGGPGVFVPSLRVRGTDWHSATGLRFAGPPGSGLSGNVNPNGVSLANATSTSFTNLYPGTTYEARLKTRDFDGFESPWSAVAQAATETVGLALSPRKFTADPGGKKWKVQLQWRVSSGSVVTTYNLRWRTSAQDPDGTPGNSDDIAAGAWQNASGDDADCAAGAGNPENCGEQITAMQYMVEDLTANTEYDFEVRAYAPAPNANEWSNRLTATMELPSADASLASLALAAGGGAVELSPAFDAGTLSYTAEIRSRVSNVDITPTAADARATIKVGRAGFLAAAAGGSASAQLVDKDGGNDLQTAGNIFHIEVTAEDKTKTTYEIAITRQAAKSDASLAALEISSGLSLSPAFSADTFAYSLSMLSSRGSLAITPTLSDAGGASVQVGRAGFLGGVASGATSTQTIDKENGNEAQTGGNTFLIVTTSEDGSATRTYTITASRRKAGSSALLTDLRPQFGVLSPAFAAGVTSYFLPVNNNVIQMTITPTAEDPGALIQVGRAGFLGPPTTRQNTVVGGTENVFLVVVTAEDGASSRTYTVDVFRGGAISKLLVHDADETARTDANSLLATSAFNALVPAYSLQVEKAVTAVVITATFGGVAQYHRSQPTAVPASLTAITSNTVSDPIPLAGGENVVLLRVHTADYPVTISRPLYAPDGFAATPKSQKLRLAWEARGGESVYRLRWRRVGRVWQFAEIAASPSPRYTLTGLTNGLAYEAQVRGESAVHGNSEWSDLAQATPFLALELPPQNDLAFVAGDALAAGEGVTLPAAANGSTPHTYALTGLPAGLTFDRSSREITGTPATAAAPVDVVYEVTDNDSVEDRRAFRVGILDSYLNVAEDGTDGVNAADGILIARYLLGVRGAALPAGQSELEAARLEAAVQAGVHAGTLDVDGDGGVDEVDGILIARYLLGLRGADLVAGFSGLNAVNIEIRIADLLP